MSLSEEEAKEIAIKLQADKSFKFVSEKIEDSEKIVSFLDMPEDKQILIDQLFDKRIKYVDPKTPKEIEGSLNSIEKTTYINQQHAIHWGLKKFLSNPELKNIQGIRWSDSFIDEFKTKVSDIIQKDTDKIRLLIKECLNIDLTKIHPNLQAFFNLPTDSSEHHKLFQENALELINDVIKSENLHFDQINLIKEYWAYLENASYYLKEIKNGCTYIREANHYSSLENLYKLGKQFNRLFMIPHENEIIRKYKQRKEAQKTKPDTEPWFELYKTLKTQNPTQSDLSISEEIAKQFKVDMQDSCKGKDKLPILVAREKVRGRLKPLVKKWKESQQKK